MGMNTTQFPRGMDFHPVGLSPRRLLSTIGMAIFVFGAFHQSPAAIIFQNYDGTTTFPSGSLVTGLALAAFAGARRLHLLKA